MQEALDKVFREAVELSGLQRSGLQARVVLGGESFSCAFGVSGDEKALFHWGSCAKALAGVLVAVLVEEGRLRFDSRLGELDGECEKKFAEITIEQLLRHCGGIVEDLPEDELAAITKETANFSPRKARERFVAELASKELLGRPDEIARYSNAGYVLLSHIVERAVRCDWEKLVVDLVAKPLQMHSLGFGMPPGQIGHDENDEPKEGFADAPFQNAPFAVHSTLEDWTKFARVFLDLLQGKKDALGVLRVSNAVAERLIAPTPEKQISGFELPQRYACGWRTRWIDDQDQEDKMLWHFGTNFVTQSAILISAKHSAIVVVGSNSGNLMLRFALRQAFETLLERPFLSK